MASNDTAALVVALSAQISQFEKDMQSAVSIADKRTKEIETRFGTMNTAITSKLSQLSSLASGQLGFAGTLLSSLGPLGIAAAVGIGTAVGGMLALADATEKFADKSKVLKEGAETAGLTIDQFRALGELGKTVGLDFDQTSTFFSHFIANLSALRTGSGPLYDALLKIDTGLLRQLSVTKDSAAAIDLLVKAYERLDDQTKRLELAKAAGGRTGLTGGNLLEAVATQGGVAGVVNNNPGIDEKTIKNAAQLKVEITAIKDKATDIWGSMFSDSILSLQKRSAETILQISQSISDIVSGKKSLGDTFSERFGSQETSPTKITVHPVPTPAAPPSATGGSASVELGILQKNLALLGGAVTVGEQWRLKRLEIAAAEEKGGISSGIAQRALESFRVTMIAAATATRERLGVATEQQIVESRLAQLSQDAVKFNLSENEVLKAKNVILLEAKQAADALTVRQSYLPGLKQLELDALSVRKGLDTLATNSLNNLENALVDVVSGTKTAAEAFKAMANAIIADLARLAIRQAITGPLASALGGAFGGSGGGAFDVNNGFVPSINGGGIVPGRNAGGTDNWRGGLSWVGENGPELLNLPRGAQVIPNDVSHNVSGGGVVMNNSFAVHMDAAATSADPATAAANLRAMRRELEGVVEQTMQKHLRSGGLLNPQ